MRRSSENDTPWISLADMMTALMVIFMFIAISFILRVIKIGDVDELNKMVKEYETQITELEVLINSKDSIITNYEKVVDDFVGFQDDIYNALKKEFEIGEVSESIEILSDGTIRFNTKSGTNLFELNDEKLTPIFEQELEMFIPRYWKIINSPKFSDYIKEIRIEGHADTIPPSIERDSYLYNLELSSKRAASVLEFIRNDSIYFTANLEDQRRMDFLFTSVGFSFSRALNNDKEYVYLSNNKEVNNGFSRRVEFRILTSNRKLIDGLTKESLKESIDSFELDEGEFFIVPYNAYKTDTVAILKMIEEQSRLNISMDTLWIPSYKSLSGSKLYQVYYGPYYTIEECKSTMEKLANDTTIHSVGYLVSKTKEKFIIK